MAEGEQDLDGFEDLPDSEEDKGSDEQPKAAIAPAAADSRGDATVATDAFFSNAAGSPVAVNAFDENAFEHLMVHAESVANLQALQNLGVDVPRAADASANVFEPASSASAPACAQNAEHK
eukprot:6204884-Pleurochrysis_carterae.AAC.1